LPEFKDKETLVNEVIENLSTSLPDTVDFSDGEPLRTIIEALMAELDFQYFQLEQVYDNGFIDTAYGEDLDKLVALLGVKRIQATYATGIVTFSRSTPAPQNFVIPLGTLIETMPNLEGVSIQFQTTQDAVLLEGTTSVDVPIQALLPGSQGNVVANKIIVINEPPTGIESINNNEQTNNGADTETDDELKERARHVLDSSGLGTVKALEYSIKEIAGVKSVEVNNMARGIGTVDVLVLGDIIPLSNEIKTEILNTIDNTKPLGVDVQLLEPSVVYQNIDVTLYISEGYTIDDVKDEVENAILSYVDSLTIGQTLIFNQLSKSILNSSSIIIDLDLNNPIDNVTTDSNKIIRAGKITIH